MTLEERTRIIDEGEIKGIRMKVGRKEVKGYLRGLMLDFPIAVALTRLRGEVITREISWDLARRAVDEGVVIL